MTDADIIEQQLAAARDTHTPVELERRSYHLDRPVSLDWPVTLRGNGAQLVAAAAIPAVLVVREAVRIFDLEVNGGLAAEHCVIANGAGQARFEDCLFQRAISDAFHVSAEGDSSCMRFARCNFEHSGRALNQGTVHNSPGTSSIVYGSGDVDFTKARPGDMIWVGGEWLQVAEVLAADKLRCAIHPPSVGHTEQVPYSLHVGDGYREETGAASLVVFEDCRFRGCASGATFAGLYGARVVRAQSDFNRAFGFVVGRAGGGSLNQPSFRDCYTEEVVAAFFLGNAVNLVIDGLCCSGEPWLLSNPSFVPQGLAQGVMGRVAQEGIGDAQSDLTANNLTIHNGPPAIPNPLPMGTTWFMRPGVVPDRVIGLVKMASNPGGEWMPFAWWVSP